MVVAAGVVVVGLGVVGLVEGFVLDVVLVIGERGVVDVRVDGWGAVEVALVGLGDASGRDGAPPPHAASASEIAAATPRGAATAFTCPGWTGHEAGDQRRKASSCTAQTSASGPW
ncbi:MAG TPA: hypothetical protein VFL94_11310 [Actinomycetales bacterium]|nr:hypothetical protein [Actinomycetales bacterium]